jgi:Protein of unknown function (DUF3025)
MLPSPYGFGIDWTVPWLADWRGLGETIVSRIGAGLPTCDALNTAGGAPVRFVPSTSMPPDVAYESYIFDSKQCPVREDLHDFFNGICWLAFPQTKKRLNELQATELAAAGVQPVRGAVRDAITLFDENAALLDAPDALWEALRAKDWRRLFIDLRPLWADARLVVFGHAALEKLVSPRKPMVVHVYAQQFAIENIVKLDADVARSLSAERLAGKPFAPLPLLGVPGWWPANEAFTFYDDAAVFRAPRVL